MIAKSKVNRSSLLNDGHITTTKRLGLIPQLPNLAATYPMLLADLSEEIGWPSSFIERSISVVVLQGSEQLLYLFRLQIGATLICWLGDPYHPEVRSMLHSWASTGHMFAGVKTRHGIMVQMRPCKGSAQPFESESAMSSAIDAQRYIRAANDAVSSGLVKAHAQSEIDSVAKIRKLRIHLVACQEHATPNAEQAS